MNSGPPCINCNNASTIDIELYFKYTTFTIARYDKPIRFQQLLEVQLDGKGGDCLCLL